MSGTQLFDAFPMNAHAIGIVMKELVRRAIVVIRAERMAHEVFAKTGYDGESPDVFTNADLAAQAVYVKSLKECFPTCAIIGEEADLRYKPKKWCGAYFTLDPLDGTKAFTRKQSHGVGTMIALVYGGEVLAAYVGDINTQEIYGYRPDTNRVHRINEFETAEELTFVRPFSLEKGANNRILLREVPADYEESSQALIEKFAAPLVDGASIGIWAARLWKREVAALMIPPSDETPWDLTPVVGISRKLGYMILERDKSGRWTPVPNLIRDTVYERHSDMLIIHSRDITLLS